MVKLRVTARVIRENVYLAHVEDLPNNTLLRGEKRFPIVIQEPERWHIGTLANAIKNKYQTLYKHELGQIKYLKDNEDDCDLDPEELVSDLLVNEGRALTDQSDQHVTVKVIQEQGSAIREGSVIPDLTPVRYQIPVKPAVPRFEDVDTILGKRKAAAEPDDNSEPAQRRARLSEIEEDLVVSIEKDQPLEERIQDSQPVQTSAGQRHDRSEKSADVGWSFSAIGPPTPVNHAHPDRQPNIQNNMTPSASSEHGQDEMSPATKSPITTGSSVSKRFRKPQRDVYAGPESDIDDSQMSPRSRSAPRINPRLVKQPSRSKQSITRDTRQDIFQRDSRTSDRQPVASVLQRQPQDKQIRSGEKASLGDGNSEETAAKSASMTNQALDSHSQATPTKLPQRKPNSTLGADLSGSADTRDGYEAGSTLLSTTLPVSQDAAPLMNGEPLSNRTQQEFSGTPQIPVLSISTGNIPLSSPSSISEVTTAKKKRKTRGRHHAGNSDKLATPQNPMNNSMGPIPLDQTGQGSAKGSYPTTPTQDSPSEQLSQTLQESARRSSVIKERNRESKTFESSDAQKAKSKLPDNEVPITNSGQHVRAEQTITKSPPSNPQPTQSGLGLGITNSPRKSQKLQDVIKGRDTAGQSLGPESAKTKRARESDSTDAVSTKKKQATKKQSEVVDEEIPAVLYSNETAAVDTTTNTLYKDPVTASKALSQQISDDVTATLSKSVEVSDVQGDREKSAESRTTSSSKVVIVPPGMTKEEYERIIASNAHLNFQPRKISKPRSMPASRKSLSKDSQLRGTDALNTESTTNGIVQEVAVHTEAPQPEPEKVIISTKTSSVDTNRRNNGTDTTRKTPTAQSISSQKSSDVGSNPKKKTPVIEKTKPARSQISSNAADDVSPQPSSVIKTKSLKSTPSASQVSSTSKSQSRPALKNVAAGSTKLVGGGDNETPSSSASSPEPSISKRPSSVSKVVNHINASTSSPVRNVIKSRPSIEPTPSSVSSSKGEQRPSFKATPTPSRAPITISSKAASAFNPPSKITTTTNKTTTTTSQPGKIVRPQTTSSFLSQARNLQLSMKDLHKNVLESASNSAANSPAPVVGPSSFLGKKKVGFQALDDDSDDESDEDSSESSTSVDEAGVPAKQEQQNTTTASSLKNKNSGATTNGLTSSLASKSRPDPSIRDVTDDDDDDEETSDGD